MKQTPEERYSTSCRWRPKYSETTVPRTIAVSNKPPINEACPAVASPFPSHTKLYALRIVGVTAEKLEAIHTRIVQLLEGPDGALDYGRVADLVHATDDVVVSEIESWQAVFGGKHVTVPV